MALTRLFHTVFESGPVPVRLDVYEDSGLRLAGAAAIAAATGTSTAVEAAEGSRLRWERAGTEFGPFIRASFAEVNLYDPGIIKDTFRGTFSETDYLCVISADAYTAPSGTVIPAFVWYGQPLRASTVPPIAPAIYPEGATTLRVYDGLGRLGRQDGNPTTEADLLETLLGPVALLNRHLSVEWRPGAWPVGTTIVPTPFHPTNVRWAGELAGNGREEDRLPGEYGTRREQVERALETGGLVLYQHTLADSNGDPRWRIVPRAGLSSTLTFGGTLTDYAVTDAASGAVDYTYTFGNLERDRLQIDADDVDGGDRNVVEEVAPAGLVKLIGDVQDTNFVRGRLAGGGLALGTGATEEEELIPFVPAPDVFLGVQFEQFVYSFDTGNEALGYVQVYTQPTSGPAYYLSEAGTWTTDDTTQIVTAENAAQDDYFLKSFRSVEAPPVQGRLYVKAVGESAEGLDARFRNVRLEFVDANGTVINSYVLATNPRYFDEALAESEGAIVEIDRPPPIEREALIFGWGAVEDWRTDLYFDLNTERTFRTLEEYAAFDRLQQQGQPLAAPKCTVEGLHGPGRVLRFPAALLGREGVLVESFGVPCVMGGGLVLNLDAGTTEGGWTELVTNAIS